MVPYNPDRKPSLQRFRHASSNPVGGMIASIILDSNHTTFTNLDVVTGRVVLRVTTTVNISSISVKLEGESRTRLLAPPQHDNDRPKPQLEFHKILYKVLDVFPPHNPVGGRSNFSGRTSYTLPAGSHEYPFSFKIPFNTSCESAKNSNPAISFAGLSVEVAKPPTNHIKRTLPPTLSGFPGEAEIRYYLKATVARPSIIKENARAVLPFNFCPIEPPRPPTTGAETFARRKHQFTPPSQVDPKGKARTGGLFAKRSHMNLSSSTSKVDPTDVPLISIEARLPEPAILTCGKDIPLRLLCTVLSGKPTDLSLHSLELGILNHTHVRAHDVVRDEATSTVLTSKANINSPLVFKPNSSECILDPSPWRSLPIPNSLPPSFETCNLARSYDLVIRVGVRYEQPRSHPQYMTSDLRIPFRLFSGIAPPPELLDSMAHQPPAQPIRPVKPNPQVPNRRPIANGNGNGQAAAATPAAPPPEYSELPPSYEDAVADNLPSVESEARPEFAPPAFESADALLPSDEKRGWH